MIGHTLHPTPARSAVAMEQLRAVGLAVRRDATLAGLALLGVSAFLFYTHLRVRGDAHPSEVTIDVVPVVAFPAILVGFLIPLSVWRAEEPERRAYLWALPEDRGWNHLAKSASGWAWMMMALAAYFAWAFTMAAATGGDIGTNTVTVFVGENMRNATAEDFRRIVISTPSWQWLAPFTGITIAYLLGSIPALASNHPWKWLVGVPLAIYFLSIGSNAVEWMAGRDAIANVLGNHTWYGLETAFTGDLNAREHLPGDFRPEGQWVERPHLGAWLTATALWLGLAMAGTLWAAHRHREP